MLEDVDAVSSLVMRKGDGAELVTGTVTTRANATTCKQEVNRNVSVNDDDDDKKNEEKDNSKSVIVGSDNKEK